jgi:hypothetical protein
MTLRNLVCAHTNTYVRTSASLTLMSTESCTLDNCTRELHREMDSAELPSLESVWGGVGGVACVWGEMR